MTCLAVAQLMQYSYSDSYKKNILLRTRNCPSHLLTLKRRLIAYQEKSSGVASNSIYCAGCSHWVHKKCSGVIGSQKSNPDYHCSRCKVTARPIDRRHHNEWLLVQDKKLDVVDSFCYLRWTCNVRFERPH